MIGMEKLLIWDEPEGHLYRDGEVEVNEPLYIPGCLQPKVTRQRLPTDIQMTTILF